MPPGMAAILRNPCPQLTMKMLLHCLIVTLPCLALTISGHSLPDAATTTTAPAEIPHPVILFPGLAGSQMDARLNRNQTKHWYCHKKSDWYRIWENLQSLMPFAINCFVDNFRLVYNNKTGLTENVPGVETRVAEFGSVTTLEYFFNVKAEQAGYYHNMIVALESKGYVRDVSIRGAPYDFRKAPYETDFSNLTRLIEETYRMNGNKKCVLVCHSNGCTNNYYYLLHQNGEWKSKYVQAWLTLGAPLGGATQSLSAVVTGDNFNIGLIDKNLARDLERSFSSIGTIIPAKSIFNNITIMRMAGVDYKASDMPEIYQMMNDTMGETMWQKSVAVQDDSFPHPGVEVHCLRALGTPTVESLNFKSRKHFPRFPQPVFGPGDGTVNQVSSDVCLRWSDHPDFHTIEYDRSVNHMLLGTGKQSVDYLLKKVLHL